MNIKHLFRHDWSTVMDVIFITGYIALNRTEVTRRTTRICKYCGRIETEEKLIRTHDKLFNRLQLIELGRKYAEEYGVEVLNHGDI